MIARLRLRDRESGFTLIELIIYIGLMVVVSAIIGGILMSALNGQTRISGAAAGSDGGQLVSQSLAKGLRSATAVHVTTISATRELLQVATPGTAATAQTRCQAWFFTTANGGSVYTTSSASTIATPGSDTPTGWLKLADGLAKSTRTGAPTTILSASGNPTSSVSWEFTMSAGSGQPQLFTSSTTSRQNITASGSSACA